MPQEIIDGKKAKMRALMDELRREYDDHISIQESGFSQLSPFNASGAAVIRIQPKGFQGFHGPLLQIYLQEDRHGIVLFNNVHNGRFSRYMWDNVGLLPSGPDNSNASEIFGTPLPLLLRSPFRTVALAANPIVQFFNGAAQCDGLKYKERGPEIDDGFLDRTRQAVETLTAYVSGKTYDQSEDRPAAEPRV